MATPPPVTETLARFVAETDYSAISDSALSNAKMHLLDTIGSGLAAVSTTVAAMAINYCKRMGHSQEASIWGTNEKASAPMAAFTNGLLAHTLDFDDWDAYLRAGHPSSVITAAALALGENIGASGKDFLKAYVFGIEVLTQMAAGTPELHKRGFHSTPVWGSIGGVIASASLLKLDPEKIKAALGVAASGAAGIQRQQGSMVKPFHAGNAARNGVEAALLAQQGFTADQNIIEAPRGFCDTFFGPGTCDYEKMLRGIGQPYFLESPALGLKMHPCSAPQFLAADAALQLKREHGIDFADDAEVKTGLRGKFAINYVVALGVLEGKLDNDTFTDAKANDPLVQQALRRVHVIVDDSIPEPGVYCPVTIELKDGRRLSHTARIAKGHPENPMSENEVLAKFKSNVKGVITTERSEQLIAALKNLEEIGDMRQVTGLLRPA